MASEWLVKLRFAFTPPVQPKLALGKTGGGGGLSLIVTQDEDEVTITSEERFADRDEAQRAADKAASGMELLGLFLGYGTSPVVAYGLHEHAPAAPTDISVFVIPDDEIDLGRTIRMLNNLGQLNRVSEKHRTVAKLFDESFLAANTSVALILRTTGLEVLCPPKRRSDKFVAAVDQVLDLVGKQASMDAQTRKKLASTLGREKLESITEAVRNRVREVVPEVPADMIAAIYKVRAKVVHGDPPKDSQQIYRASERAGTILRTLALRELGFNMPKVIIR